MEPLLGPNDKDMFYKYLNNTNVYFEYGSGGSTYQASIRSNIQHIYSVESDMVWQNELKQIVKIPHITYIFNDVNTRPNNWGYPGDDATEEQKRQYSNHIKEISKEEQDSIDLIFIDGRFRVSCCLKCFDIINDNCKVIFDDFLNREHYHVVLEYFDIIEKTKDNRMVVLKKKHNKIIPDEVILEYELDPR